MLEGLDAVEIALSECRSIIDFRIDANTYKKEFLKTDSILKRRRTNSIGTISKSIQNFGAYSLCNFIHFQDSGIPFLMTKNVRENFIDWNLEKYVDFPSHQMLWKSHCHKGQVLITMAGEYLGRVAVYNIDREASSNQAIAKVTLVSGQSPYTISTFLNSKFGQHQIQRFKTITGQPNINMSLIESLRIPEFSNQFSKSIEVLMHSIDEIRASASNVYLEAEQTLLEAVGLAEFKPSAQNTNIKTFAQSFGTSGRLDAEYYQPKYEEVMAEIASQTHAKLVDVVTIKKSIEPGSDAYADEGLPFIRVSDFSKTGLTTPDKCLSDQYVEANQKLLNSLKPRRNTILFSKDGSVGAAYCLREDLQGVTSGAILHLNLMRDDVLPEYLTLVLNSKLVQMQAERDAGGSIILHWRVGEIENVILPIIDLTTQTNISQLVQQSFSLKAQSEHLLNVAKRAVEIAIEQDEAAAMQFIKTLYF